MFIKGKNVIRLKRQGLKGYRWMINLTNMKSKNIIIIILNGFLLVNCASRNERDFFKPKNTGVSDSLKNDLITDREISFKNQISPIILGKCIDCHKPNSTNPNSPGDYFYTLDGINIDYDGVKKKVDERYLGSSISKIEYRITSQKVDERMPYMLDPLSQNDILLIRSWIAQGAKNN